MDASELIHHPRDKPRPPPHRQRDKPQLSCNTCRRLKRRCDRRRPCGLCMTRGIASTCSFPMNEDANYTPNSADQTRSHGSENAQSLVDDVENLTLQLQIPASDAGKIVAILAKLAQLKSVLTQPNSTPDEPGRLGDDNDNSGISSGTDIHSAIQSTMPSSSIDLENDELEPGSWTRHSYAPFAHLLYRAPDGQGPSIGLLSR